ncbi:MAG: helix-turn-helix domain-containing protein [Phycisphaeraceae bacterium]|nr:helix-turn-helix domain-containing protein [Phycisphaeraceae bacterium]
MTARRLKLNEHISAADMPLYTSLVEVNEDVDSHDHDFIELAMILRGNCQHETLYEKRDLRCGDVVLLRPGVWHAYRQCHNLLVGNCGIGLPLRQRELAWTQDDPHLSYLLWAGPWSGEHQGVLSFRLEPKALYRCRRQLEILDELRHRQEPVHRSVVLAHLLLLLGEMGEAWTSTNAAQVIEQHPIHPAVHDAMALLEKRIADAWTLPDLAANVQLDRAYLARLFRHHSGLPPMAYLNRLRLERAAAMLLGTQDAIGNIAVAVGLPDANYFARRFHKHFGITPSQMRREQSIHDRR